MSEIKFISKPFVIDDERTASLTDWIRCYAHEILRPNGHRLLVGLVPDALYAVERLRTLLDRPAAFQ